MKRLGICGVFSALAVVAAIIIVTGSAVPALAGGYNGTPKLQLGGINSQSGPNNTQTRSGYGTGSDTKYNKPYQPGPSKVTSQPKTLPGQQSLSVEKRQELNVMIPKTEEK